MALDDMSKNIITNKKHSTEVIAHNIPPVWNSESQILILGTMPSPASRKTGFFYMHPQNRFWLVLSKLFNKEFNFKNNDTNKEAAILERKTFLLENNIAIWDVLAECEICGAQDSSIKNIVPNDFSQIFNNSKIAKVFCTGTKAFTLYKKHCACLYPNMPYFYLPSTSPANCAKWNLERLVEEYKKIITQ